MKRFHCDYSEFHKLAETPSLPRTINKNDFGDRKNYLKNNHNFEYNARAELNDIIHLKIQIFA